MIELTRVGNVIVLEYFSPEDKRILEGKNLTEDEREQHVRMLQERDFAFAEIGRVCNGQKLLERDPLQIQPGKYRNQNALGNPFLRF